MHIFITSKKKAFLRITVLGLLALLVFFFFCLPKQLFDKPYSRAVFAEDGSLLCARIASDGQWRFPQLDSVPRKFQECIIAFEDNDFRSHIGVDFGALGRAMYQNISAGEIVSGASTLSMQVIRLSRKNPKRTYLEKALELIRAMRLESRFSKDEIMRHYAAHAPMGGNVVGIEAAAWRYFGRSPYDLSWAECALLAALPNAPSLMHPGKNRTRLREKRDRILGLLLSAGKIDSSTYKLSALEPIPKRPRRLPQKAAHLLLSNESAHEVRLETTLDFTWQKNLEQLASDHHKRLKTNEVHNICAVVVEVETGAIKAYLGNTPGLRDTKSRGMSVDIVKAPRSTGSILKPLLHASMLDDGLLLPQQVVLDVPTSINGYNPKNFDKQYAGLVPADQALSLSLNVPAVRSLQKYGLEKFLLKLKQSNQHFISRTANHYGLSLILGGAETSVWDIAQAYSGMAKTINQFGQRSGRYRAADFTSLHLYQTEKDKKDDLAASGIWRASSIYQTFEAMCGLTRPSSEMGWQSFLTSRKIAWKTGTSFGQRDAWAVGVTPKYVVAVWVGNADGTGRPGNTGISSAAPIMFDIFNFLPQTRWFKKPFDDMHTVRVCGLSGFPAGTFCTTTDSIHSCATTPKMGVCPYHQLVLLSSDGEKRVRRDCYPLEQIRADTQFVVPTRAALYYKQNHAAYEGPPPMDSRCATGAEQPIAFVFPTTKKVELTLPKDFGAKQQMAVFECTHQNQNAILYWYLDGSFLGTTEDFHQREILAERGEHSVVCTDENGNSVTKLLVVH